MKALMFAVCILATAMMGDALLLNILKPLKSELFDIAELFDFHKLFTQCALELGLLKIVKAEIVFCIGKKKNLIDEDDGIMWDESVAYVEKIIRDANKMDEIKELMKECKEKGDKFEGSTYEKTFKVVECGLPIVKYIVRQSLLK